MLMNPSTEDFFFTPESRRQLQQSSPMLAKSLLERLKSQRGSKSVDLSLCDLTHVPLGAIGLYNREAKCLNISHNLLGSLGSKFALLMVNLTRLDLSRNCIEWLPSDFGSMIKLTYVDIHHNKLSMLPMSMHKLKRLQYLNVSENPLRPPLSTFLEIEAVKKEGEDYRINVAHPVLKFLSEFAQKTAVFEASGDGLSRPVSRRGSRRVAFDESSTIMEVAEDPDENMNVPKGYRGMSVESMPRPRSRLVSRERSSTQVKDSSPSSSSHPYLTRFLKTVTSFTLLLLMTPLILSSFVTYSFFDKLAESPGFWSTYQGIHSQVSSFLLCSCNLKFPLLVQPPPPNLGVIEVLINTIRQMLWYVVSFVWK